MCRVAGVSQVKKEQPASTLLPPEGGPSGRAEKRCCPPPPVEVRPAVSWAKEESKTCWEKPNLAGLDSFSHKFENNSLKK